ncbi:MAG: hypothetical protein FJ357_00095 [Thaumarchaeota archaeon]|nr:hypothetical protein [Nitrososphaerota archaeon]
MSINGPYGMFTISQGIPSQVIMVGDDIGITPCMSMILYAAEEQLSNRMALFFSKNSPYKNNIESVKNENRNLEIIPYEQFNQNVIKKVTDYQKSAWYVAGTPGKTEEIRSTILKSGVPQNNIKVEEFAGYQ